LEYGVLSPSLDGACAGRVGFVSALGATATAGVGLGADLNAFSPYF
jgi:hypothetical protein